MLNSKTIYIVDDEPEILSMYQESIKEFISGVGVELFHSGADCVAKIEGGSYPDLVITDLKMPGMNGYVLAKKIFSIDARIPVLLNTAYGEIAAKAGGIEIGYRGIIDKGIPINDFIKSVERHLKETDFEGVDNYLRIDYEMLLKLDIAPFSTYVKLNDGKFVNLINSGDKVPREKIREYQIKGVNSYYIELLEYQDCKDTLYFPFRTTVFQIGQSLDFNVYIRGKDQMKKLIARNTQIVEGHLELLKKHSFKELFYDNLEEPQYLDYLDKVINSIVEDEKGNKDENKKIVFEYTGSKMNSVIKTKAGPNAEEIMGIAEILEIFTSKNKKANFYKLAQNFGDNNMQHHCIRVAFLCMGVIYKILQWRVTGEQKRLISQFDSSIHDGKEMRKMVITAAMTHDLGCVKSGDNDEDEYDCVQRSVELIEKRKAISPKIAEIVLQHKEMLDGSGGPSKLMKRQMSIYSQLLSLVNYYDELVSEENNKTDAIIDIQMNEGQFNQGLATILSAVVEGK